MTGITRRLAEFAAGIDFASLGADVVERTRMLLMDQVGICIRGRNDAGLSASMAAALRHLGLGSGNASVIGDGAEYSPPAAALFNGNLGHSLDFDDTHASGSIHPSAPIVPAALAAAEMAGADGRTVIAAVVAGYEVQIRLSLALGPSDHYQQGFHPTATCGVFGAAAAAGRVLGLDASQMEDAFGLCGSLAAGSMQFLVDGAWNKPFHTGYAAMNGLVAVCMAREGFRGCARRDRGQGGLPARLRAERESGSRCGGFGRTVGNAAHRDQAVSFLPVQPCTARRADRVARGARHRLARRDVGGSRGITYRMEHHRGSGRGKAASDVLCRWPVLDAVLRSGGAARRCPHLGFLR